MQSFENTIDGLFQIFSFENAAGCSTLGTRFVKIFVYNLFCLQHKVRVSSSIERNPSISNTIKEKAKGAFESFLSRIFYASDKKNPQKINRKIIHFFSHFPGVLIPF